MAAFSVGFRRCAGFAAAVALALSTGANATENGTHRRKAPRRSVVPLRATLEKATTGQLRRALTGPHKSSPGQGPALSRSSFKDKTPMSRAQNTNIDGAIGGSPGFVNRLLGSGYNNKGAKLTAGGAFLGLAASLTRGALFGKQGKQRNRRRKRTLGQIKEEREQKRKEQQAASLVADVNKGLDFPSRKLVPHSSSSCASISTQAPDTPGGSLADLVAWQQKSRMGSKQVALSPSTIRSDGSPNSRFCGPAGTPEQEEETHADKALQNTHRDNILSAAEDDMDETEKHMRQLSLQEEEHQETPSGPHQKIVQQEPLPAEKSEDDFQTPFSSRSPSRGVTFSPSSSASPHELVPGDTPKFVLQEKELYVDDDHLQMQSSDDDSFYSCSTGHRRREQDVHDETHHTNGKCPETVQERDWFGRYNETSEDALPDEVITKQNSLRFLPNRFLNIVHQDAASSTFRAATFSDGKVDCNILNPTSCTKPKKKREEDHTKEEGSSSCGGGAMQDSDDDAVAAGTKEEEDEPSCGGSTGDDLVHTGDIVFGTCLFTGGPDVVNSMQARAGRGADDECVVC
ncbi:unnamed protein product [Amoebophrya sp. A25]|nr:unnamed protein product [Amoebophrya sp. A25]|eukprot:GSA25T00025270001.1